MATRNTTGSGTQAHLYSVHGREEILTAPVAKICNYTFWLFKRNVLVPWVAAGLSHAVTVQELYLYEVFCWPHLIQCYCTLVHCHSCKCFISLFHICVNSDLSIRITALHVTHTHNAHRHWAEVEARFTGDLNHFASLIYTVCNPKRLAETLNARLESPKLFKWGPVEGSPCLGLFFTYWDNGIKCVTLETSSCFTGLLKPTYSPGSTWSEYRAAGLLVCGAEVIAGSLSLSSCWTESKCPDSSINMINIVKY